MIKILVSFFSLMASLALAQVEQNSDLYKVILAKDSQLFDTGFNRCSLSPFEELLSDDFEFYHDKGGYSDRRDFITNLGKGLCASPGTFQSRRDLLSNGNEVYPLYKEGLLYGAVQKGVHRFYETVAGKKEAFAGSAKFTHLWLLKDGTWKLARSLSYDHQPKVFDREDTMEKWLTDRKIPVLGIGVIKEGKVQQVKVFGNITKGNSAPFDTIFNVASLAKPVTAMVALKLVDQGKWSLDEPLDKYWLDPDVAKDPRIKILTTRHILSHQSGFPNWRYLNPNRNLDFKFTPGTRYQYSGEGFEYLRKSLENKFRKTLNQLAAELIFKPLNLTDTQYAWDKQTDEARFAVGYDKDGKSYPTIKNTRANAADDLLTTVGDYSKFMASVANGAGLSKRVFNDMTNPQVATKNGKHFGLGFERYDFDDGEYALSYGGADEGVQTLAIILPKTGKGLVIFTNVDDGYKIYDELLNQYLGDYGRQIVEIETAKGS